MDEITRNEREVALELDERIKAYANAAFMSLMEAAKCLKKMRDTKLYKSMGYETFEEYTVESLNIKERQAYTYIKAYEDLGERFLQSNASLGITKLSLLAAVPPTERDELVEQNDLAGMTVEQVKQLVAENDAKAEQIDLLTDERDELNEAASNRDRRIAELEAELEAERNKPVEVAVKEPDPEEIRAIKEKAEADAKKAADRELKAAKKELTDKHKKELAEAAEKAQAEKDKAVAEYKEKLKEIDDEKAAALKRADQLEKQLTVSASPESVKFQFYFDSMKADFGKICESISTLLKENPETGEKFKSAMVKYTEIMKNGVEQL